jgi:hypothetical protein
VGSYEHSDEPSGSIKGREFLHQLSDYCLLKMDSVPWSHSVSHLVVFRAKCKRNTKDMLEREFNVSMNIELPNS